MMYDLIEDITHENDRGEYFDTEYIKIYSLVINSISGFLAVSRPRSDLKYRCNQLKPAERILPHIFPFRNFEAAIIKDAVSSPLLYFYFYENYSQGFLQLHSPFYEISRNHYRLSRISNVVHRRHKHHHNKNIQITECRT